MAMLPAAFIDINHFQIRIVLLQIFRTHTTYIYLHRWYDCNGDMMHPAQWKQACSDQRACSCIYCSPSSPG